MEQSIELNSIRNAHCTLCDGCETAKTICIMGKGNIHAKLMFIGESPGAEEDKEGVVFIGQAGKMLDSICINTGIDLANDVYTTNVFKCHPPFNNKPSVNNLGICSAFYLRKEVQLVKPELIVCLGSMAAKTLLSDYSLQIANVRKTLWYTQGPLPQGIPIIVTYHPAATFHNPELLEFIVEDLEWAKRLLKGELPKSKRKDNYVKLDSIQDIPNLKKAKCIDLDLETDGLDAFLPNKDIMSLQISIVEGEGYYFDFTKRVQRELHSILSDNVSVMVSGHNIKFDLKWLRSKAGISFIGKLNDTIQNIHLLDENFPSKGLDTVATSFTEKKGHKDTFVKMIKMYIKMHKEKKEPIRVAFARLWKQAYNSIPLRTRIAYGVGDADATGRLRRIFRPKLKELGLLPLHRLMMNVTKTYIDIECNGIKVDEQLIDDMALEYKAKIDRMTGILDSLVPHDMNHGSPLQLRYLLYSKWRLPNHEIRMGKRRVNYSTGKDALELILTDTIADEHREYITNLLEYRKLTKTYGTYIIGLPRYIREGGLIHANWNLVGTVGGRSSCNDPNLQQIPRTGDVKRLFISRYGKSGVLMQIDVSQGELRWAAHVANERNLIRLFNSGVSDIHKATAASLLHKLLDEVTDDQRYNAKQVNFAILFGSGAQTMAQEMKGVTLKEAYKFIQLWHKQFPDWKKHVEDTEEFIINNGYIRNLFGRYRRKFILDPTSGEGHMALRQLINAEIQGGLSDFNKLCGYNIWKRLKQLSQVEHKSFRECLFVGEQHDSWLLDMPKHLVHSVAEIVKEEYENVNTSKFGFKLKVPMKVEIKVGRNWKEMEEYGG